MGSTFTWIFQEQLDRLQEGDRFYYFNQLKDAPLLLADIGSQHFSDIIMRNTGLDHMHFAAFKVSERLDLGPDERAHDFSGLPATAGVALVLVGNEHDNTITVTAGDHTIYGEDGDDTLNGGLGLDALHGGKGNDILNAGAGPLGVFAYGEDGNDDLNGNSGDDNLIGGAGNDIIRGGPGKDFLSGGLGDDWLVPGADPNMVDGGYGNDTVDYSGSSGGVNIDLGILLKPVASLGGYAQGDVISSVENIVGSGSADTLIGNHEDNRLDGGLGNDMLFGGGGSDTFVFNTALNDMNNLDTINDFTPVDDVIQLENTVFTGLPTGTLASGAFALSSAAGQADDRIIYDNTTGQLFFDADGGTRDDLVGFATLANKPMDVSANDFFII
jgi:Ca2+-binding RTX toxin-like protein